jgi:hypothetical protein
MADAPPPAPALIAAVLAPIAVLAGWLVWGGAFAEPTYDAQLTPFARDLAERMKSEPDVIVFGNSQSKSAVDEDALGMALGLPGEVAHASVGGAFAPTIYAAAKHRVFGAGVRPKLVLVPMSVAHLLTVKAPDGNQATTLANMLTGPDPVLDDKIFGVRDRRLDAVVTASQFVREAMVASITTWPLRLLGVADADAAMDRARDAVFGEVAGSQLVLNARMIPVVEPSSRPDAPDDDVDLDRTLLPDFVDLATANGARIVFVTLPQRTRNLATPPALMRALSAYLEARGSTLIRLDQLPVPADGWLDVGHVNPRGGAIVTEALGRALKQVGALEDGPLRHLPPPLDPPVVTRRGDPPVPTVVSVTPADAGVLVTLDSGEGLSDTFLSALGHGQSSPLEVRLNGVSLPAHRRPTGPDCAPSFRHNGKQLQVCAPADTTAADLTLAWAAAEPHGRKPEVGHGADEPTAWWLPAGGALELTWDPPIDLPPGSTLDVMLAPLSGKPGSWTLSADGRHTELASWEGVPHARLALGGRVGTITVAAARGTGHAYVRALVLNQGPTATWLAGRPEDRADRLVLVPGTSLTAQPRAVPEREIAAASSLVKRFLTWPITGPDAALTDAALMIAGQDERFGLCVPFEPVQISGGFPLKSDVRQTQPGRAWMALRNQDPTPGPADVWSLRTPPTRLCGGAAWIAPGETIQLTAAAPQSLAVTVTRAELALAAFGSAGAMHVRLTGDDDAVLAEQTFEAADLSGARVTLPLTQPLPPRPRKLVFTVTGPADAWSLVGTGALTGADLPADAWFATPAAEPTPIVKPDVFTPAAVALRGGAPEATAPAAGPPPTTLAAVLAQGVGVLNLHPPGAVSATAEADAVRVAGGPTDKPTACLPDLPAAPVQADARVRLDGAVGNVDLTLRWLAGGKPLPDVAVGSTRARAVGATPVELKLAGAPPPGADGMRVCLRSGASALIIEAWQAEVAP